MHLMRFLGVVSAATIAVPPTTTDPPEGPGGSAPTYPDGVPSAPAPTYLSVAAEPSASGSLTIEPSVALSIETHYVPPARFRSEMGYESVAMRAAKAGRRGMRLRFTAINSSLRNSLVTFYEAHTETPFSWTAPDDTSRKWVVFENQFKEENFEPGIWNVEFPIIEVK